MGTGEILNRRFSPKDGWLSTLSPELPYRGILAGASTLIFGGTDTLTGTGALVGSATLTFDGSGTLDGPDTGMSGASTLSLGGSGALSGLAFTIGSAVLAFGEVAVSGATVSISGSSNILFGGTPFLKGYAPTSGISELVFQYSVTPLLGKLVPISGSSALAIGGLAVGSTTGKGGVGRILRPTQSEFDNNWFETLTPKYRQSQFLSASSSLVIGGAGTLAASGALVGNSTLIFGESTNLRGTGTLTGSGTLAFDGSAPGNPGFIVGAASLSFGAIVLTGLSSSEIISLSATGTLTGTGNLQGTSLLSLGNVATLSATGMFGSATLRFTTSAGPIFRGLGQRLRNGYDNLYPYSGSFADLGPRNPIASKLIPAVTPLVIGGTGALTGTGALAGSASLIFGAVGSSDSALSASASIVFVSNATPRADGALVGQGNLSFSNIGSIYNGGPQVGSASILMFATAILKGKGTWTPDKPKTGAWTPNTPTSEGWGKKNATASSWVKKTGT